LKGTTVKDRPLADRPRERLARLGVDALTVDELLAIILISGSGESVLDTARRVMKTFGGLRGVSAASVEQLCEVRGIGLAKATQIRAAFELANRLATTQEARKAIVKTPEQVVDQVGTRLAYAKKEHFKALLLSTRGGLIRIAEISVGSLDASIVHPREVFSEAIGSGAASVIFAHNHPSGDPEPSPEDVSITGRLVKVGELVGIDVLDHVIIAGTRFVSMKRKGLL
jgi:DNA repair protein RadC